MVGIDYSIGQNVAIYDLNTGEIELITKYNWTQPDLAYTYYPLWSPDGKEIAFLYADTSGYYIKIATEDDNISTVLKGDSLSQQNIPRQWSQDGRSILTINENKNGIFNIGITGSEIPKSIRHISP